MPTFFGLSEAMLEVYTPARWSSNVHNLPRMRNKDVMMALGEAIEKELGDALEGTKRQASDEIPNVTNHRRVESQWVFWSRDAEARAALSSFLEQTKLTEAALFTLAAQDKHALLGLQLRHDGVWAGLRIAAGASVDRRNVAAKLKQSWEREHLGRLLAALPGHALCQLGESAWNPKELDAGGWNTIIEALEVKDNKQDLMIGCLTLAPEIEVLGKDLPQTLAPLLTLTVPLYRFCAWSRDNDLIEAGRRLQQEKADKRRSQVAFDPGQKVRIVGGLMRGKQGVVQNIEAKSKVRVMVGTMSVVIPGADLSSMA